MKCPLCNHEFTHKKGMKFCPEPCGESAVDYNAGTELDLKYNTRYIGAIVDEDQTL